MNSHVTQDIRLLYEAVYDQDLREKADEYNYQVRDEDIVEVATEYFYTYGLNSDGVDILIEKVGLDNFVEFVYDLSEDYVVLDEATQTRLQKMADRKGKIVRGPTGTRPHSTTNAAIKKYGGTIRGGISGGEMPGTIKKKAAEAAQKRKDDEKKPESRGADTEAKEEQPKSKKPVRDAIARRILSGMDRHRQATQTAGRLAGETARTIGKIFSTTHEAGRRAGEHVKKHGWKSLANEDFEYWVNSLVNEGYDLSDYTWDDMYEYYVQKLDEQVDLYDIILSHLLDEGYADTNEDALAIMANMSEEWRDSIVDEMLDEANKAERMLGLTSRERGRARNLNQYTDRPIFYKSTKRGRGDNSDPLLNKAHKGMSAKRQQSHKAGRHLRGDTGESGNVVRSRYQANKDHENGYPSIRRVDT